MIFGRVGKPRSHWIYRILEDEKEKDKGVKTSQFSFAGGQAGDEKKQAMIIELRGDGGYTTTRSICEQLNLRGVPNYGGSGRKWHIGTTHKLLQRVALTNFAVAVPQTIFFL